jgi:twinkle protein
MAADLIPIGEAVSLPKRGLSEETCKKWRYTVSSFNGKDCQIANYCDEQGQIVAQKIRLPGKDFTFLGDTKAAGLFGQHLWRDGGKMVVITEGEIDALSVSQLQGNKWPVVSVPNGASGAKKAIMKSLDWLEKFEAVVFMFDNDEPGIEAAKECAPILTPGKAKIAKLPLKDANEMLQAGRGSEVIDAIWSAKVFRPDGIVAGTDLWDAITKIDTTISIPYPWPSLNEKTRGLRKGELVTFTAGSGIGKSQVCREIAYHLMKQGENVGYIALEESTKRTALGLIGIELNKPLHLSREGVSDVELKKAFDATVGSGHCYLYDHFGSIDSNNLMARVRYLARGCGCGWIVLDHLSIVVSGNSEGDERRLIDNTMTSLRSMVQETGVGMILVSHLKRPTDGKGHEEGAQTSLAQLRGSAAIGQLSDLVIGLERNQQSAKNSAITTVRILKNRWTGQAGIAGHLKYDDKTARLNEQQDFFPVEEEPADKDF